MSESLRRSPMPPEEEVMTLGYAVQGIIGPEDILEAERLFGPASRSYDSDGSEWEAPINSAVDMTDEEAFSEQLQLPYLWRQELAPQFIANALRCEIDDMRGIADRVRAELVTLSAQPGFDNLGLLEFSFGASDRDVLVFASQLLGQLHEAQPIGEIMSEPGTVRGE